MHAVGFKAKTLTCGLISELEFLGGTPKVFALLSASIKYKTTTLHLSSHKKIITHRFYSEALDPVRPMTEGKMVFPIWF